MSARKAYDVRDLISVPFKFPAGLFRSYAFLRGVWKRHDWRSDRFGLKVARVHASSTFERRGDGVRTIATDQDSTVSVVGPTGNDITQHVFRI